MQFLLYFLKKELIFRKVKNSKIIAKQTDKVFNINSEIAYLVECSRDVLPYTEATALPLNC